MLKTRLRELQVSIRETKFGYIDLVQVRGLKGGTQLTARFAKTDQWPRRWWNDPALYTEVKGSFLSSRAFGVEVCLAEGYTGFWYNETYGQKWVVVCC